MAEWLRKWADRIDDTSGPRLMSPHSFTFEDRRGIVFREDHRGCPIWYMNEDYDRAHDEADTEHVVVLWKNLEAGVLPKTRRAGGSS
jgi:hypothetical protein